MARDLVQAKEAFSGAIDGERINARPGDLFEADHPAVRKWPHLFIPVVLRYPIKRSVEQATAAPGEKRGER